MNEETKYKVGDIVMLKENLLKVEIVGIKQSFFSGTQFVVKYAHLDRDWGTFEVSICEIEDVPFDYDQVIFDAYIKLLTEHRNLLLMLRRKQK